MNIRYYEHKLENLLVVNKIITIHFFEFDKDFKSQGEAHDFWELVYTDKEKILCTSDGRETVLYEGEVLFHKPNEHHTLSADGESAPTVLIVSFACKSEAMKFFENKRIRPEKKVLKYLFAILNEGKSTFEIPYSDPNTKKMKLSEAPPLGGQQIIKNNLELFLIHLLRSETEKKSSEGVFLAKTDYDSRTAIQTVDFLRRHVRDRITIEDVSRELNYNKSYIFRQFKKATGTTVMEYFNKLKIDAAKQMLSEGKLNVTQIADALSFDTPNYFSKFFKKHTGKTPVEYRQSQE